MVVVWLLLRCSCVVCILLILSSAFCGVCLVRLSLQASRKVASALHPHILAVLPFMIPSHIYIFFLLFSPKKNSFFSFCSVYIYLFIFNLNTLPTYLVMANEENHDSEPNTPFPEKEENQAEPEGKNSAGTDETAKASPRKVKISNKVEVQHGPMNSTAENSLCTEDNLSGSHNPLHLDHEAFSGVFALHQPLSSPGKRETSLVGKRLSRNPSTCDGEFSSRILNNPEEAPTHVWVTSFYDCCEFPQTNCDALFCSCCMLAAHYNAIRYPLEVQNTETRNFSGFAAFLISGLSVCCCTGVGVCALIIPEVAIPCACCYGLPVVCFGTLAVRTRLRMRYNIHGQKKGTTFYGMDEENLWMPRERPQFYDPDSSVAPRMSISGRRKQSMASTMDITAAPPLRQNVFAEIRTSHEKYPSKLDMFVDLFCSSFCVFCAIAQHHRELVYRGGYRGKVIISSSQKILLVPPIR